MKICPRCNVEKKTNQGIYCRPCAHHFNGIKLQMVTYPAYKAPRNGGLKARYYHRKVKVTLAPIGK
jgi:hypothetical protein